MIVNRSASIGRLILKTHSNLVAIKQLQTYNIFHSRLVHISPRFLSLEKSDQSKKSVLSNELNDILSKQQASKEPESSSENTEQKRTESEEQPKGRIANAFSREHGWKVTLALFGGIFTGGALYTLFAWGAPQMNENNLPVDLYYFKN